MAIRGQRFNTNASPEQPQPPSKPESPAPTSYKPPVDRQDVDHTRGYFLYTLALLFFALSSVGTIMQVGAILLLFYAYDGNSYICKDSVKNLNSGLFGKIALF
jgi:hypothetical protein